MFFSCSLNSMKNGLLNNIDKIHTTELGVERIKKNLSPEDTGDAVEWCRKKIKEAGKIIREGKNWYAYADNCVITVNAHSFTVITAHKDKKQEKKGK